MTDLINDEKAVADLDAVQQPQAGVGGEELVRQLAERARAQGLRLTGEGGLISATEDSCAVKTSAGVHQPSVLGGRALTVEAIACRSAVSQRDRSVRRAGKYWHNRGRWCFRYWGAATGNAGGRSNRQSRRQSYPECAEPPRRPGPW